jgi:hypothetical protein
MPITIYICVFYEYFTIIIEHHTEPTASVVLIFSVVVVPVPND